MPSKKLRDKPFSESTVAKLGIFEDYTQAWIPVWSASTIHIFDLFAGTGYDKEGVPGSPIRILNKIKEHLQYLIERKTRIVVHLNEFEPKEKHQENFELLKESITAYERQNENVKNAIQIKLYNEDFERLFPKLLDSIRSYPSLVFLDQNGIRFLSQTYLNEFANMKQTDVLYFAAASYFRRFGREAEFRKHLELDLDALEKKPYKFVHRELVDQLRGRLPVETDLKLYPFSLQKGANIFGVIFGASHPLAVDKFLDIAWRLNNVNGEANFDIDDDGSKRQGELFEPNLTKKESFQRSLTERLLLEEIVNNKQALDFTYSEGHPASQAHDVLMKLKRDGRIAFEGTSPLVNYRQVYREHRILEYSVMKK